MPSEVFACGVEARLLPAVQRPVEGVITTIPEHWAIVSIFAGVDDRGRLSMYSCLTGVDTRGNDIEGADRAIKRALRHYPVDGCDIRVDNMRVVSRTDRQVVNRLRPYKLWVPSQDLFAPDQEDQMVTAVTVGFGIGIEVSPEGMGHVCPYLAALVYEEQRDKTEKPVVVPARLFAPYDPKSRPDPTENMHETIPELFGGLVSRSDIGGELHMRVASKPTLWYALESAYQDTVMGQAFAAVNIKAGPSAEV